MKNYLSFLLICSVLLISCGEPLSSEKASTNETLERVRLKIGGLKDSDINEDQKKSKVSAISEYIEKIPSDSLRNEGFFLLAYSLHQNGNSIEFLHLNERNLLLSQELKDTSKIAEAYWDRASFFNKRNSLDSAFHYYNKAQNLYDQIGANYQSAKILLCLAMLQKDIKDFTGSEISTIRSLKVFQAHKKYKYIYGAYNNLGIIYNNLEEYDKALKYHKMAAANLEEWRGGELYKSATFNNIGVVHQNLHDHEIALDYFQKALETKNLLESDPELYAMLLDNKAYSRLHQAGANQQVFQLFQDALKIRDSMGFEAGIVINNLHLADFHAIRGDSLAARTHAEKAMKLAKRTNNNLDLLESLSMLSYLDSDNKEERLEEYIRISDSLNREERKARNKFQRIRFETDQHIERTKELTKEKIWIAALAGTGGMSLFLIILLKVQRSKNRELNFEKEQESANKQIYQLLIKQQAKMEEGRQQERARVSEELHDGILGRLFGTRMSLGYLGFNNDVNETYQDYLNELHIIEGDIRDLSHDLNQNISLSLDFIGIIENLISQTSKNHDLNIEFKNNKDIDWDLVDENVQINLFRILQESILNIVKHSAADNIKIFLNKEGKELILEILDNGKGFNTKRQKEGIGLKNMRARIKRLNGKFIVESSVAGTKVFARVRSDRN